MSDRTYFQLVIYGGPAEEIAAFRAAMSAEAQPIGNDPRDWYAPHLTDLATMNEEPDEEPAPAFPMRWSWEECQLDAATSYGPLFEAIMPGATFECWADPAYEYPGELYAYAPDLGSWVGTCNADGEATSTAAELLALIDKAESLDALREAVADAIGAPWHRRAVALIGAGA